MLKNDDTSYQIWLLAYQPCTLIYFRYRCTNKQSPQAPFVWLGYLPSGMCVGKGTVPPQTSTMAK